MTARRGENLFSLIVGPMVWAVHFLVVYVIIAIACAKGAFYAQVYGIGVVPLIVIVVTVIAVGLIVHGIVVAMRRWRGSLGERRVMPPHDQSNKDSRRRFMAYAGLLLCGLALIATLWVALPVLFMHSCR